MQGGGEICETSVEEDETPYGHGGAGIKEDDEAEDDGDDIDRHIEARGFAAFSDKITEWTHEFVFLLGEAGV